MFFNNYTARLFVETSEKEFKLHLYDVLFNMKYNDFTGRSTDDYINNYIIDIKMIFSFIMECFYFLLTVCSSTVLIVLILFYYNIKMALISFSIIPVYIIVFCATRNYSGKKYEEIRELSGEENAVFKNIIECMPIIRTFNAIIFYYNKIQEMLVKIVNKNIKIYLFENLLSSGLYVASTIVPILIVIFGVNLIANNEMTIGVLILFYTYSFKLIPLINQFVNFFHFYQKMNFSYKKLHTIFEYSGANSGFISRNTVLDMEKITIRNLNLVKTGKQILRNINLELHKGDVACLYGENGSGKTTLLNVISGLLRTDNGDVFIDEIHIENIHFEDYFKYVSYLPQSCSLLNDTILNNMTMGKNIDINKIAQICKKLDIYDFINSLNGKFNFMVTGNGEKFSGGERKMICFARMLLHESKLILLDEFSNDLDNNHKKIINGILNEIKENSIIVYVTHFNEDINLANKFVHLHKGEVADIIYKSPDTNIHEMLKDL
jgi:ABC-type bacteriocin/lantibiotic exporter with double-glycine peptidase domain